jgi:two-component system NtrC family sensor kinase
MKKKTPVDNAAGYHAPQDQREKYYSRLFRRFILLTLACSIVPLLAVGWGINLHYTNFARERMTNSLQTQIGHHKKIIELFLQEHSSKLQLIAQTHSKEFLSQPQNLQEIFDMINRDYWSIRDLGLIDSNGQHLAYIGPYDLMDKNYSKTFWFKEVMDQGIYISDMFMGFRKVPHFVIAVVRKGSGEPWILRATIDTDSFRSLVENVKIGKTGEVYLVNREGVFQTTSRFGGTIMSPSETPIALSHDDIRIRVEASHKNGNNRKVPRQIVCQTWLKDPQWMLVVKQDYAEAFYEANHANLSTLIFLHLAAVTILVVIVFISRHMIRVIQRRDHEADHLNQQLMQTGKLAAIGELSAGVAHEINNPLAIILTERQLLLDSENSGGYASSDFQDQFHDAMEQIDIQVQRCKRITHNLLRFSRRTQSVVETVDLNAFIQEVVDLVEREALASGIKFFTKFDEALPPILSDPSQLQQVFLNMITNSIDAHDGNAYGRVEIQTRSVPDRSSVRITIADSGSGIDPKHLDKIFDPFFTTKPVGKGTGLGLSICYSIIQRLGGEISVQSDVGQGTEIMMTLPIRPPDEVLEDLARPHRNTGGAS